MIELEKRIKLLESRMALRQKEKKRHEPFMVLAPWSIAKDETIIKYYPEGLYTDNTKNQSCVRPHL